MSKIVLTTSEVRSLVRLTAERYFDYLKAAGIRQRLPIGIYGVPRGGVPVAYLLEALYPDEFVAVNEPEEATVLVDDLIDSGDTCTKWLLHYPAAYFTALIDKRCDPGYTGKWVVFPWEIEEEGIEANITRLLQFIGEDPKRGGLLETPRRVSKAWAEWTAGYGQNVKSILKTFADGADNCDEMVMVRDIPFYTHCEHHMAPFFGTATVAYIPNGRIVGLSKIPKVVDVFARRLQVQERLTNQIADAINDNLSPKGVGVVIKARHLCMESRGINKQGHHTVTSALRGVFRDLPEARAEFLDLAK